MRSDKELLDYLERWGGRIKLYDDIDPIEVVRHGEMVFKPTGILGKFTFTIGQFCPRLWSKRGKKEVRLANLRQALNAAIDYRECVNAKLPKETVLKDLQEYADECRARDEERIKEDPKVANEKWAHEDERDVLKVKAFVAGGQLLAAAEAAQNTDTFIRDGFPDSFRRYLIQNRIGS